MTAGISTKATVDRPLANLAGHPGSAARWPAGKATEIGVNAKSRTFIA